MKNSNVPPLISACDLGSDKPNPLSGRRLSDCLKDPLSAVVGEGRIYKNSALINKSRSVGSLMGGKCISGAAGRLNSIFRDCAEAWLHTNAMSGWVLTLHLQKLQITNATK